MGNFRDVAGITAVTARGMQKRNHRFRSGHVVGSAKRSHCMAARNKYDSISRSEEAHLSAVANRCRRQSRGTQTRSLAETTQTFTKLAFSGLQFHVLQSGPSFSRRVFSRPVTSCYFVRRFRVLHVHLFQCCGPFSRLELSCPAFSATVILAPACVSSTSM